MIWVPAPTVTMAGNRALSYLAALHRVRDGDGVQGFGLDAEHFFTSSAEEAKILPIGVGQAVASDCLNA